MKFSQAIAALEKGKKIRCSNWTENIFIDQTSDNHYLTISYAISVDWELYEEPEKTLSWPDVLKGLKEGKKFKRKKWDKVIRSTSDYGIIFSSELEPCIFCTEDFEATDWIEVQ